MEPIIYKPGAYKTPGVYKGDGSVYNGHGVYNGGDNGGDSEYIKVGNLLWSKKNLDIEVSGGNYVQVPWPNAGKLYRGSCIDTEITPSLSDGWRVPTNSDFQNLYNELIANNYFGAPNPFWALAINDNNYNYFYNGNYEGDTIGYKAYITGFSIDGGHIRNSRTSCNFWTSTDYGHVENYDWCMQNGSSFIKMHHFRSDYYLSIRLCKDA